ncbi:sulfotransferase [Palleronia sediminis]|uniref:Sulfotransferase n=2 Tax=Palleronia sediminis TaxID=2547833 RepID=A0A4R6AB80_9RHOB|nr:sulfotransferase [Palleronia sediminis]
MPNLFVIGASKSGSSALHAYLRHHPDIAMSREKEPCFFVDRDELRAAWPIMARQPCSHDLRAYLDLWSAAGDAPWRGEGSVYYSQAPHRSGVPGRVRAACPEARIVYLVREPVSRAISHFWQRAKEFQEPLPLDRAVRENPIYVDTSDYALQLDAWLAHFDRDRIKVIVSEDLRARRREVLADLSDWLGLDPHEYDAAALRDVHASPPVSRRERFPLVARMRDSGLWAAARRTLPPGAIARLRKAGTVEIDKAATDETDARRWLAAELAPRTARFERMMGGPIAQWHAPPR